MTLVFPNLSQMPQILDRGIVRLKLKRVGQEILGHHVLTASEILGTEPLDSKGLRFRSRRWQFLTTMVAGCHLLDGAIPLNRSEPTELGQHYALLVNSPTASGLTKMRGLAAWLTFGPTTKNSSWEVCELEIYASLVLMGMLRQKHGEQAQRIQQATWAAK